jgi:lysophospholipid acyltransferase (LPLAT)-like uncharacterized protein
VTPEPTAQTAAPAGKRISGVVVPHRATLRQRLGAWVIFLALRGLALTLRRRVEDRTGYIDQPSIGPAIYVIWHNRLALCLETYRAFIRKRHPGRSLAAMVSASKDGGFLAGILERYGVQPVRGSSSRRGAQALLELTGWAERGYDLAITPDGPRGPRYVVQAGVISLAQVTGLPVVPVSYSLSWRIQARSWDGFLIPLPFARWELVVGKPLLVPREATDAGREDLRQKLEAELRAITRE